MTINHVRLAFQETIPTNQKFVFVVLCDMANSERACWPGVWLIAKKTSLPEEIVLRELGKLAESGLIEIQKNTVFMGKIREKIFFVYPDKQQEKPDTSRTSYSNSQSENLASTKTTNAKPAGQPVLAREIAKAQIAEIKNRLSRA